ncbi:MAG: hypothetical protein EAZ99_07410 [Alphaproteobacteria bacterium]|nr:MAG: hypothetical protein EAZ99_07410 [Alphaproteobacteria bacterium]
MSILSDLSHWLHDMVKGLHDTHEDPIDDDAFYLEKYPDLALLSDEDIHGIAEHYISRMDYTQSAMHTVRDHLFRLRAVARGETPPDGA